jgi:hypothetical protein
MQIRVGCVALVLSMLSVAGCDQVMVREPKRGDVAGMYELTSDSLAFLESRKGYASLPLATIELRLDGRLFVRNLPDCVVALSGDSGGHFLSGRGIWKIEKAFVGYGLTWEIAAGDSLPAGGYAGPWVAIRRRSPPLELELTIGDPDSGERIRYQRSSS